MPSGLNQHPIAVIAVDRWSNITRQGIEFAARLSPDVIALHVEPSEHSELLEGDWEQYVEKPFRAAGKQPPKLHLLGFPTASSSFPWFSLCSIFRRRIQSAASS